MSLVCYMSHYITFYGNVFHIPITWWRHQMETFLALLPFCAGNSPVTGEFPSQRPVTRALMFSVNCASINAWVNNRKVGDLRRHCAHYDVIVMINQWELACSSCMYDTAGSNYMIIIYIYIFLYWIVDQCSRTKPKWINKTASQNRINSFHGKKVSTNYINRCKYLSGLFWWFRNPVYPANVAYPVRFLLTVHIYDSNCV